MELVTLWFILIAVLWIGYFVLEGFDFGVGILLPYLGRDNTGRRVLINTIGPLWDGNEVWVLVAGGATFAAFPEWYATLFSGFYLPLLLILLALILRGVAFEYRGKNSDPTWQRRWDAAIVFGSFLPALLWGVAFANIVRGLRIDRSHEYVGGFWALLNPYALLGGLTTLALFVTHGAIFLALKTTGDIRAQAGRVASRVGLVAAVLAVAFLGWTLGIRFDGVATGTAIVAALAFVGGLIFNRLGREGWAFIGTAAAIAFAVATLFLTLYPNVMPSTIDPAFSLTVDNASSSERTLGIMTWVAVIFTPIVLAYQSWSFWVFRKRIGRENIPVEQPSPAR